MFRKAAGVVARGSDTGETPGKRMKDPPSGKFRSIQNTHA